MRLSCVFVICALATPALADVELRNDSFEDGQPVVFQGGFVAGEMGASRFVAPEAGRTLVKVQFLFGQSPTTKTMTLKVFDDTAGTDAPGDTVLLDADVDLMGSDTAMQEIPTTDIIVVLPQQFRVALEFQHNGVPTIATDNDMTNTAGRNFIFAGGQWRSSNSLGVKGDWIIRPFVSGEDVAVGGPCTTNPDCPVGEFCDTAAGTCAFECRNGNDCGGDTCNSLGQCVDAGGGGCCDGGRGGGGGALFAAGVLVLVLRRRRCG